MGGPPPVGQGEGCSDTKEKAILSPEWSQPGRKLHNYPVRDHHHHQYHIRCIPSPAELSQRTQFDMSKQLIVINRRFRHHHCHWCCYHGWHGRDIPPELRSFVAILRFVAICALFGKLWAKKRVFLLAKTVFIGHGVHYYIIYILQLLHIAPN